MLAAAAASLLIIGVLVYTLGVRKRDLPEPEPESPTKHLEARKATIYDNLRDLQFEYRLGKLSDGDYQQTKQDLQRELALVVAQIESVEKPAPAAPKTKAPPNVCPHCGAKFSKPMKFCGECGKSMLAEAK
jgi:hypothetical protein